jgi:peptidoglycan/LPS O-acetylase OafA/YrhL
LSGRPRLLIDPHHPGERFRSVDGLRALAVLAVIVHHVAADGRSTTGDGAGARFLHNLGGAGLALFIVTTGFLLYWPFALAALRDTDPPEPVRHLIRQVIRIWPVHLLTLGAYLALGLDTRPDVGPAHWFTLATLTQGYRQGYDVAGPATAWVAGLLLAFAIVLPFVSAATRALAHGVAGPKARAEAQIVGLATLIGVAMAYRWLVVVPALADAEVHPGTVVHLWLPNHLDWFALGMALAVAVAWRAGGGTLPTVLAELAERPVLCWMLAGGWFLVAMAVRSTGFDELGAAVVDPPVQLVLGTALNGAAALFVLIPVVAGPPEHAGNRVLGHAVPASLGVIAYGLLLWHAVWLEQFRLGHEAGASRSGSGPLLGLVVGASLASAIVSWLLVERPLLWVSARTMVEPDPLRSGSP